MGNPTRKAKYYYADNPETLVDDQFVETLKEEGVGLIAKHPFLIADEEVWLTEEESKSMGDFAKPVYEPVIEDGGNGKTPKDASLTMANPQDIVDEVRMSDLDKIVKSKRVNLDMEPGYSVRVAPYPKEVVEEKALEFEALDNKLKAVFSDKAAMSGSGTGRLTMSVYQQNFGEPLPSDDEIELLKAEHEALYNDLLYQEGIVNGLIPAELNSDARYNDVRNHFYINRMRENLRINNETAESYLTGQERAYAMQRLKGADQSMALMSLDAQDKYDEIKAFESENGGLDNIMKDESLKEQWEGKKADYDGLVDAFSNEETLYQSRFEKEKSRLETSVKFQERLIRDAQDSLRRAQELGNEDLIEKHQDEIVDYAEKKKGYENRLGLMSLESEAFLDLDNAIDKVAVGMGFSINSLPGDNAIQKARYLNYVLNEQIKDNIEERTFQGIVGGGLGKALDYLYGSSQSDFITGTQHTDVDDPSKRFGSIAEMKLMSETLTRIVALNKGPKVNEDLGFWNIAQQAYSKQMTAAAALDHKNTPQEIVQSAYNMAGVLSLNSEDLQDGVAEEMEIASSPYDVISKEGFAQTFGNSAAFMADIMIADALTFGVAGKVVGGAKLASNAIKIKSLVSAKNVAMTEKAFSALGKVNIGTGLSKAHWAGLKEGIKFDLAGTIGQDDSELNFMSGYFGAFASDRFGALMTNKKLKDVITKQIYGQFAEKGDDVVRATYNFGKALGDIKAGVIDRPFGEVIEEYGNSVGNIYRDSSSWSEMKSKFEEQFGTMKQNMEFVVSSYVLGLGFGIGSAVGDFHNAIAVDQYNKLTDKEKKVFGEYIEQLTSEEAVVKEAANNDKVNEQGEIIDEEGAGEVNQEETAETAEDTGSVPQDQELEEVTEDNADVIIDLTDAEIEDQTPTPAQDQGLSAPMDVGSDVAATQEPVDGQVASVRVDSLVLDPVNLQYKATNLEESGATGSISKEVPFEKKLAGVITVWKNPKDGKTYVVNGHNRYNKALESGAEEINVQYITASSAKEARSIGAMQNIAEGNGSPMDAARYFRDSGMTVEDLKAKGIGMNGEIAKKGMALSNLSDELFRLVVDEKLSETKAVIIGETISSPEIQNQAYQFVRGKNISESTFREVMEGFESAPTETEQQVDLFGTTEVEKSKALNRFKVIGDIRNRLTKDKNLFGSAARNKDVLEQGGSTKIDKAESQKISEQSKQALAIFNQLKNSKGPVADLINETLENYEAAKGTVAKSKTIREGYAKIREYVSEAYAKGEGTSAKSIQENSGEYQSKSQDKSAETKRKVAEAKQNLKANAKKFINESRKNANMGFNLTDEMVQAAKEMFRSALVIAKGNIEIAIEKVLSELKSNGSSKEYLDAVRSSLNDSYIKKGKASNAVVLAHNLERSSRVIVDENSGQISVRFGIGAVKMTNFGDTVVIDYFNVPKNQLKKAASVAKELIETAEALGFNVVVNLSSLESKSLTEGELRSAFMRAGLDPVPGNAGSLYLDFDKAKKKKEALRDSVTATLNRMIADGNHESTILEWLDSNKSLIKKAGYDFASVKRIVSKKFKENNIKHLPLKKRAESRTHRYHQRVMNALSPEMAEEVKAMSKGVYTPNTQESVNAYAAEMFAEILSDNNGNILKALEEIEMIANTGGMIRSFMSMVIVSVAAKGMYEAMKAKDIKAVAKAKEINQLLSTTAGSVLQMFRESATPEQIAGLEISKLSDRQVEAIGLDYPAIQELLKEVEALQKEMLGKDLDIEALLIEAAKKDERIAKLIDILNSQDQVRNTATPQNTPTPRNKPNRTKKQIDSLVESLEKFKSDLDGLTMSTLVPPGVLKAMVDVVIATLKATGNTIEAIDKGIQAAKESKAYKDLSADDQKEAIREAKNIMVDKLDAKKDIEAETKKAIRDKKLTWNKIIQDHLSGNKIDRKALAETISSVYDVSDEMAQEIEALVMEIVDKQFNDSMAQAVKKKFASILEARQKKAKKGKNVLGVIVDDIVNGVYGDNPKDSKALLKVVQDSLGVDGKTALSIIDDLVKVATTKKNAKDSDAAKKALEKINNKHQKHIERHQEQYYDENGDLKNRMNPEKIVLDVSQMIDDIRNGAISEQSLLNAFSEYYGFKTISPKDLQKLNDMVALLTKMKDAKDNAGYSRVLEDFEDFLRQNTYYSEHWSHMMMNFIHVAVLSGLNTIKNAWKGAISTFVIDMVREVISNPSANAWVGGIIQVFRSGAIKRGLDSAIAASIRNENDTMIDGTYLESYGKSNTGKIDYYIKFGMDQAWKNLVDSNGPVDLMKNVGQTIAAAMASLFKVTYLLGAPDVFLNLTTRELLQYVEQYQKQTEQISGTKSKVKNIVTRMNFANWSKLHSLTKEAMNNHLQEQVEKDADAKLIEFKKEMDRLGIKLPVSYRSRFIQNSIDVLREEKQINLHKETIKNMMLMNDPLGYAARLNQMLSSIKGSFTSSSEIHPAKRIGMLWVALMSMFPRIISNSTAKLVEYTPFVNLLVVAAEYGLSYKPGKTIAKYSKGKIIDVEITPEMHSRAYRNAVAATLMQTALMGAVFSLMFRFVDEEDEDLLGIMGDNEIQKGVRFMGRRIELREDRPIDITYDLGGFRFDSNSQSNEGRTGTFRIMIGDSEIELENKYMVQFLPMLNYFGKMRDELMYDYKDGRAEINSYDIGQAYISSFTEMSFNQTIRNMEQLFQAEDDAKIQKSIEIAFVDPLMSFSPRIHSDLYDVGRSVAGDYQREIIAEEPSFLFESLLGNIAERTMLVNQIPGLPRIDQFGNPMPVNNKLKSLPVAEMFFDNPYDKIREGNDVYEVLDATPRYAVKRYTLNNIAEEFNIMRVYNSKTNELDKKGEVVVNLNKNERYNVLYAAQLAQGNLIREYKDELMSMPVEERKQVLDKIHLVAKNLAVDRYAALIRDQKRGDYSLYLNQFKQP